MMPVLFSLGSFKIYTMGVFLAFGLFFGLYYWWKLGRDEHLEEVNLFDAFFLSLIAFLIVGRTGYVALHAQDLGTVYRLIAFLRYPGISYSTGVVGALLTLVLYARAKMWDTWKIIDAAVVSLSLILTFGAFGAFLNGSNPGREGIGFFFPGAGGRRFPVDLMGALFYLITFGICVRVRKNFRFYSWYKGDASVVKDGLTGLVFMGMSGLYFVIRGFVDDGLSHFGFVPLMSLTGIALIISSFILIMSRSGQERVIKLLHINRRQRHGGLS